LEFALKFLFFASEISLDTQGDDYRTREFTEKIKF